MWWKCYLSLRLSIIFMQYCWTRVRNNTAALPHWGTRVSADVPPVTEAATCHQTWLFRSMCLDLHSLSDASFHTLLSLTYLVVCDQYAGTLVSMTTWFCSPSPPPPPQVTLWPLGDSCGVPSRKTWTAKKERCNAFWDVVSLLHGKANAWLSSGSTQFARTVYMLWLPWLPGHFADHWLQSLRLPIQMFQCIDTEIKLKVLSTRSTLYVPQPANQRRGFLVQSL